MPDSQLHRPIHGLLVSACLAVAVLAHACVGVPVSTTELQVAPEPADSGVPPDPETAEASSWRLAPNESAVDVALPSPELTIPDSLQLIQRAGNIPEGGISVRSFGEVSTPRATETYEPVPATETMILPQAQAESIPPSVEPPPVADSVPDSAPDSAAGSASVAKAEPSSGSTDSKPVSVRDTPPVQSPAAAAAEAKTTQVPAVASTSTIRVEAYRGTQFVLKFDGTGWLFVGEQQGMEGVQFLTRAFETNEVVFTLMPRQAGKYLLEFQRHDDSVSGLESRVVSVEVKDPETALPASASASSSTAAVTTTTIATPAPITAASVSVPPPAAQGAAQTLSPGGDTTAGTEALQGLDALRYAIAELDAGRVQNALPPLLRLFSEQASETAWFDQLYYQLARCYELDSPFRDIQLAYRFYSLLRDQYPRSTHRRQALERIAWLERHFPGLR